MRAAAVLAAALAAAADAHGAVTVPRPRNSVDSWLAPWLVGQGSGHFGSVYRATPSAKLGDLGSRVLPKVPTKTVWTAGAVERAAWTM